MALSPTLTELLEYMVCPLCRVALTVTENEQGLKCGQCRRVYPIRDGIPVMLIDEASVEE